MSPTIFKSPVSHLLPLTDPPYCGYFLEFSAPTEGPNARNRSFWEWPPRSCHSPSWLFQKWPVSTKRAIAHLTYLLADSKSLRPCFINRGYG